VTGQRKVGIKGAAALLGHSFLLYPVLPTARSRGEGGGGEEAPAVGFARIHFGTG
jgi:hypothetical protein